MFNPCINDGAHDIVLAAGFVPFCRQCGATLEEIRGDKESAKEPDNA